MGKPYSMDLRERVVAAVDPGGLLPLGGGAIWGGRQHGDYLGSTLPRNRQLCAGPDGWAQAKEDFGEAP